MSIDLNTPPATSITIRPEAQASKKPFEYTTGKKVAATEAEFLGHEGGFNFSDLLDIINPLQHIPVVSTIYRELTGDTISPGARMLGGGLLGGITGILASAADSIFEQANGKDMGASLFASLTGGQQGKNEAALKVAEKMVDDKEAASASADQASVAAPSITATRELIASAREANQSLFNPAVAELDAANVSPSATAALSPAQMKQLSAKYREAQLLTQQQSMMLDNSKLMTDSSKDKKDKEDGYYDGLFDTSAYRDWLSQIS